MVELGYTLSSEEHAPNDLVRFARRAEEVGFSCALISDHFHPWIGKQGHSPFVWSVIGGIAQATERLRLGTGVTCPTIRIHPTIIAQAAATSAAMMPGRFFLGVGSGENLNEHIVVDRWPSTDVRLEMLEEAVEVIRLLWEGGLKSHRGQYYTVENAQIFSLPEEPIPIMVAAVGPKSGDLAGRIGDGLINHVPSKAPFEAFDRAGGAGKPRYGQVHVCWGEDERAAKRMAHEIWPVSGLTGGLKSELPLPRHFEGAAKMVTEDAIAEKVACGPDPQCHLDAIQQYVDAGYDHVYIHQIGPDQEGFFRFCEREILPRFQEAQRRPAA